MKIPTSMPRLKGFRFPREVIAYAVWSYHRFALSTADVEDLRKRCFDPTFCFACDLRFQPE